MTPSKSSNTVILRYIELDPRIAHHHHPKCVYAISERIDITYPQEPLGNIIERKQGTDEEEHRKIDEWLDKTKPFNTPEQAGKGKSDTDQSERDEEHDGKSL